MPGLIDFLPTADALIELSAEDLGMILLHLVQQERVMNVALSNLETPLWNANSVAYPHQKRMPVGRAVAEAWQWLQTEGLLMAAPDQPNGFFCLTRKGASIKNPADVDAYRHGNLLPAGILHPKLAEKVRPMFLRGDYAIAVQQAFIEIEIAVRTASGLSNDWVGVKLMREAFKPEDGKLTDKEAVTGERVAMMELFAGAIGHCKNPPSHRRVEMATRARLRTSLREVRARNSGYERTAQRIGSSAAHDEQTARPSCALDCFSNAVIGREFPFIKRSERIVSIDNIARIAKGLKVEPWRLLKDDSWWSSYDRIGNDAKRRKRCKEESV